MGALIPLILTAAPYLAQFIGLEGVMRRAGDVVEAVTGTRDPIGAAAALADPAKAAEMQLALARLAAEAEADRRRVELETLRAALGDAQSARALAGASPLIARTQVTLAAAVIAMFSGMALLLAFRSLPFENRDLLNIMLGALIVALQAVVGFFYGASTSAHSANNALAAALNRGQGGPAAVATTGTVNVSNAGADDLNAASLARSRGA